MSLVKLSHMTKIKVKVTGMNMLPSLLGATEKSCGNGCGHITLLQDEVKIGNKTPVDHTHTSELITFNSSVSHKIKPLIV